MPGGSGCAAGDGRVEVDAGPRGEHERGERIVGALVREDAVGAEVGDRRRTGRDLLEGDGQGDVDLHGGER